MWEVISGNKMLSRNFKVWDIGACSKIFKVFTLINLVSAYHKKTVLCHLCHLKFKLMTTTFQVAFIKDSVVSVNSIRWSPDGSLFGKFIIFGML